jgi:very-short-patch-repair endonuclease
VGGRVPGVLQAFGLPEPTLSTYVAGYEADAFFEEEKIVIELDSWTFHNDKDAFESDRDRDVDRLLAGCITVRITWERIKFRSAREAARLRELAARRRRELAA